MVLKLGRVWVRFDRKTFREYLDEAFHRITPYDVTLFLDQLGVLYNCGIPIMRALSILARQWTNRRFCRVIEQVRKDIEGGETISGSFARFPQFFSAVETNVLKVGEALGDLPRLMEKLSQYKKRELDLQKKMQAAMLYPLVVFSTLMVLIFFLTQYLFQRMLPLFQSQGLELPFLTRVLMSCAIVFQKPYIIPLLIVTVIALWPILRLLIYIPSIQAAKDRFLWKVPTVGVTLKKMALARFCYHVSLLYESGMSLLKVLAIAADASGNLVMEVAIHRSIDHIRDGEPFSVSLKKAGFFPAPLVQMVYAGESAGKIPECLQKLSDYYEMEVNLAMESFVAAIEPIMISVMGCFVGAIIFIMLSPLYNLIARLNI